MDNLPGIHNQSTGTVFTLKAPSGMMHSLEISKIEVALVKSMTIMTSLPPNPPAGQLTAKITSIEEVIEDAPLASTAAGHPDDQPPSLQQIVMYQGGTDVNQPLADDVKGVIVLDLDARGQGMQKEWIIVIHINSDNY